MQASRSGGKAAQSLWQLYVQQRSQSIGSTLPSSKNLWDVVNRRLLEPHGADAVRDIWLQVPAVTAIASEHGKGFSVLQPCECLMQPWLRGLRTHPRRTAPLRCPPLPRSTTPTPPRTA